MLFINFSLPVEINNKLVHEENLIAASESFSQVFDDKVLFKVGSSSSISTDTLFQKGDNLFEGVGKNDYENKELKLAIDKDSNQPYEKDYSPERDLEDLLSTVEPCQDVSKASSEVDSGAASDSADTSSAQLHLISLTENELTANDDISSSVSYCVLININFSTYCY